MNLANGDTNKFFSLSENDVDRYYVENFNADEDSYNNYVAILSNEVPEKSIVLDVGCAQGKFGYYLSKKDCIVYGIERNVVSAKHAISSGNYKDVFIFDIFQMEGEEYIRFLSTVKHVDVIIIADVLEHMADPTSVLYSLIDILKENGLLLVSVPNIAHADIYLNLMNGIFNYTDLGILDNTHLKFFTKRSFLEWIDLFNQCYPDKRLDCDYLGSSFYYSDYLLKIRDKNKALFKIIEQYPEFNSLQIFFKLRKLASDENAEALEKALSEKPFDVVEVLGSVIEGRFTDNLSRLPAMPRSERSWYDHEISNLREKIGNREWEISQKDNRIEALLKYVSELEEQIKKSNFNLAELDTYVKDIVRESGQKDKRIDDLLKYVSELEERARECDAYIKQLGEAINQKDKRIDDLLKYVTELEERIKECDAYIKQLGEAINQKDKRIEDLLKYVSDLENEVKNKAVVEGYVSELEVRCEQKDKRIEELLKCISELQTEVSEQEACVKNVNMQLTNIKEKMQVMEQEYKQNNAEKDLRIEKLTDDLRTARKTIFEMENSTSWKITKFMRRK